MPSSARVRKAVHALGARVWATQVVGSKVNEVILAIQEQLRGKPPEDRSSPSERKIGIKTKSLQEQLPRPPALRRIARSPLARSGREAAWMIG